MKITQYFISRIKLTNLIIVFIVIAGGFAMMTLPRQDSPNVDFNFMIISTVYPGASPGDVEINVTDRIEDELEKVDGIEEFVSFSIEGMSMIYVQMDADAEDLPQVKEDIRSAVDRVTDLPAVIEERPRVEELKSTDFPIMEVAIVGKNSTEETLRKIARDLESDIKAAGQVGAITRVAYRKKEVQILGDLKKMEQNYISFADIWKSIAARNIKLSGGTLETFVDEKKIVTFSEFDQLLDVGEVIIRSNYSGRHVKVSDIAEVRENFRKREIICRTNGIDSINLLIKRRGSTDIISLSKKIDKVIGKYKENYKERGIDVVKVVDFTHYTNSLLNIVSKNAFIGFVLVVIALFVFLNLYTAFWVAVGIPLSVLAAYLFFPLFGITTNQITLITLIMVLGMLVDDAIVIAENISRHTEEGKAAGQAAVDGTREVFRPVLATISTTILCFLPMYFMKGILGKFVMSIPVIVFLTLIMSLLEAVTLLPAHLSRQKSKRRQQRENWILYLKKHYERVLTFFLNARKKTLLGFIIMGIISLGVLVKLTKFELFATEDFDIFYLVMEAPVGTSLDETFIKVKEIEKVVAQIPAETMFGYKTIVGDHRTDEAASDPSPHENWALITVYLHPASKRDIRSEQLIDELKLKLKGVKGFDKLDVREIKDGPPVGEPITLRLVSDDMDLAQKYEEKIMSFLRAQKGVYDLETSNREGKKEVRLRPDFDYMAKVGITAMDVANTIRVAYDGQIATTVRRDGEEIDFRVKLNDKQRQDLTFLKDLQLPNNQGNLIKLGKFVSFDEGIAPQTINHFNGKKAIMITGKVHDEMITSSEINKMIRENFEQEITRTPGIALVFGGEEKETMESMDNFLKAFVVSILGIYFILVLLLDSFYRPALIMVVIPFGLIGVLGAFYLHGVPMGFMGLVGTLGMIGVVVNDSLVMVSYLDQKVKELGNVSLELIIDGAKTRLRPVLLTTITTVLGLLPTVYGWGGYEPFLVPMVLAMSWGLIFATVITLILVPVLYSVFEKSRHAES